MWVVVWVVWMFGFGEIMDMEIDYDLSLYIDMGTAEVVKNSD